jgi:hypothetical protein
MAVCSCQNQTRATGRGMSGKHFALAYREGKLHAIPIMFHNENDAIEIIAYLLRAKAHYQILLYDPTGKLIATYKPE